MSLLNINLTAVKPQNLINCFGNKSASQKCHRFGSSENVKHVLRIRKSLCLWYEYGDIAGAVRHRLG